MMGIGRLSIVVVLLLLGACTSMESVDPHGDLLAGINPGDHLSLVTRDGIRHRLVVEHVDARTISGGGQVIAVKDIVRIQRRRFSWLKSVAAYSVAITVVGTIAILSML